MCGFGTGLADPEKKGMRRDMQEKVKDTREKSESGAAGADAGVIWRARLRRLASELAWMFGACLLGQAPMAFGTRPLGLALLCAGRRHTLSILVGLISASIWQPLSPIVYICTYLAAALVRTVTFLVLDMPESRSPSPRNRTEEASEAVQEEEAPASRLGKLLQKWRMGEKGRWLADLGHAFVGLFGESLRLRMLTGTVCAFIIALYRIIAGGFLYYDLFAAVFVLLVTPAAILVYSVCMESGEQHPFLLRTSQAALLFSLVWASGRVLFLGIPVAVMLSLFVIFYACAKMRYGEGLAVALLCGFGYQILYVPAFLLAAVTFLFFKSFNRQGAGIFFAGFVMVAWVAWTVGAGTMARLVPAALLAGSAASIVLRKRETGEMQSTPDMDSEPLRLRVEGNRHKDTNDRFRGISDAFSSLSEMFYNLSDRFRRPGTLDLHRICDSSFDRFCADCPNKTVCWGLEYSDTLGTVNSLIAALHTKGRVARAQIPSALAHRCDSVDSILACINEECAKLTGEMLRNNRTEIFAMDYASAASIINDALEEDDGEYRFDDSAAQRIAEYLTDAGVKLHGVTVYGNRRRRIMVRGVDMENAKVTVDTLCADLGELCGMELGRPVFEVEGNISTMTLQARQQIAVIGAQNNLSADGGVSGDTVNLFSNKKEYFYALINDGMGAGKEAALTSGLCSVFLEKMLRAGNRASTSLKMLNNMIRSRGADSSVECSSTVDLAEIDLMTATASFIKSGAAPSFVVRGKVVHRLQAGTAPIGIIGVLDMQSTTFYLKEGDTVVMVSDGILQDDPECDWLTSYLSEAGSLTPDEIVYHICLRAARAETHDDCSAVALRIVAAEREVNEEQ